jgi:hypothetical protein
VVISIALLYPILKTKRSAIHKHRRCRKRIRIRGTCAHRAGGAVLFTVTAALDRFRRADDEKQFTIVMMGSLL